MIDHPPATPRSCPEDDASAHVLRRGLLSGSPTPTARVLTGGVSGVVVLVRGEHDAVVVKKALARLDVPTTWEAKPERTLTEAAALAVLHPLTPQHTPALLDVDADLLTMVMSAAPPDWVTWKELLLSGEQGVEQVCDTARLLGTVLGTWHRDTWHDDALAAEFADYEALEQLRVSPFHRAVAARHPELAPVVLACADELLRSRDCLVHGDFSPKNVLVGSGMWVLDMEVAHVGAAVFDLAFMLCHLMLKALHLPDRAGELRAGGAAFLEGYRAELPRDEIRCAEATLATHTACLLLARVDGQSPASYLATDTADAVREVAVAALRDAHLPLDQLWDLVETHALQLRRTLP